MSIKPDQITSSKGAKNVFQIVTNTKLQITVMVACNAVGEYVVPMILFPGERLINVRINGFQDAVFVLPKAGGWTLILSLLIWLCW